MGAHTPSINERDAVATLRQAMLSVRVAVDLFEERVEEVLTFDASVTDAQTMKAITRLKEAFIKLSNERQNFEKEFYGRTGIGAVEPFDAKTARAEIGSLLDRIRKAGDQGSVSE
ncbi:MAG: hypothetical protein AAGM21_10300 [Pseudomonadota bacterium]